MVPQYEEALLKYIRRAKKRSMDAALLVGTSKDLLEAVSYHVILKKWEHTSKSIFLPF